MIVREQDDAFIMIQQHHHAQVSGAFINNWNEKLYKNNKHLDSLLFAVDQHDCGWIVADKQPIWNDQEQAPYTFINFPLPLKTLIYRHGIDQVMEKDAYASLLCSEHYTRFMMHEKSEDAKAFIQYEKGRQNKLIQSLPDFDISLFSFHYALLQLCDNLSLYLCLNRPGKNEHPFSINGFPFPQALHCFMDKISLTRINENTLRIEEFPFKQPFSVTIKQKSVSKQAITSDGLMIAYNKAPIDYVTIQLIL